MSTITGTVTHRVTIGHAGYTSPLTIAAGATVSSSGRDAIHSERRATVVDLGTVLGGIGLTAGHVSLGASGYVEGHSGVSIDKGVITNRGTIKPTGGGGVALGSGATLLNSGTITSHGVRAGLGDVVIDKGRGKIRRGVVLAGGTLENLSKHGHAPVISGPDGVLVLDGPGVITNSGTIEGTASASNHGGVYLSAGGSIDNSGLIQGSNYGVDFYRSAAGTVTNRGTIMGTGTEGFGIYSYDAAVMVDNAGGLIEGGNQGILIGGAADVTNAGTIIGTAEVGVQLLGRGRVDNSGAGALCIGYLSGVYMPYTAGTVINRGTIEATGTSGVGIDLKAGGEVVDAGTISGHTAIYVGGSGNNLVELDPGASISGSVIAAGTANLIELASGAPTGTISGLGTVITGFDEITVDAGAAWRLSGDDSGVTVTNNGTISIENGDTLLLGGLAATGRLDISSSATVEFTGTIAAGQIIVFTDSTGFLGLYDPAAFFATIDGFRSGDVIDLFGEIATRLAYKDGALKVFDDKTLLGTLHLSGHYTTSAFQLSSDHHGGTEIALRSSPAAGLSQKVFAAIGACPPDFWTQPQS